MKGPRIRPILWRLPLLGVVLVGFLCLQFLDRMLRREYVNDATARAAQTDALLESFIRDRVAFLHSLQVLVAQARTQADLRERFTALSGQISASAPDVLSIYLLDGKGVVRDVYPRTSATQSLLGTDHYTVPAQALALQQASASGSISVAAPVTMRDGGRGMLIYDPIMHANKVDGFVAAAFVYRALFGEALSRQLQGRFAYRLLESDGSVVAQSPGFSPGGAQLITREVVLPAEHRWALEVAVPRFQPMTSRLITWLVGLLLILLIVLLIAREEARAERLAQHSFNLELLSRDLLDANVRLEERAQQVIEANRAKSRFLANVSHELRTPLNAIVGYNSLALDGLYGVIAPQLRTAHERIAAAAEHLMSLVNDVLDLSKIEVGRMDIHPEQVDLYALLDSVLTVIEPTAAAKGVAVDLVCARELPRVRTDPRHVRQIMLNLAVNAVKFTERGSVALIARRDATAPDARVELSVEDTGVGIAEQDLDRIFEEFEQVRPNGRGDSLQRGTGLGLTIARKLARLLGGDVTVESRLGAGSRFTLTLPIAGPEPVGPGETPSGGTREISAGDDATNTPTTPVEPMQAVPAAGLDEAAREK
jgi:signal transduction histidine kinase